MSPPPRHCRGACTCAALLGCAYGATHPDEACDSAVQELFIGAFLGRNCSASGNSCPVACIALFEEVLGACAGANYTDPSTGNVTHFRPGSDFASAATTLGGACEEPVIELVLNSSFYAATCEDAASILNAAWFPRCSSDNESGSCPSMCRSAMQATYSLCEAAQPFGEAVQDTNSTVHDMIRGVESYYSMECAADAGTCEWGLGCNFSKADISDTAQTADIECEFALATMFWDGYMSGECRQNGTECPSSCTDLFQAVVDKCSGRFYYDPTTGNAIRFTLGVASEWYFGWLVDVCQEPVLNLILNSSAYHPICVDAAAMLWSRSRSWCSNQTTDCSELCQDLMQATYELCAPGDKVDFGYYTANASEVALTLEKLAMLSPGCAVDMGTCQWQEGCHFDDVQLTTHGAHGDSTLAAKSGPPEDMADAEASTRAPPLLL